MIHLTDVRKSYMDGNVHNPVLRGVDLHVRPGEFAALMGASGSGKTTLLNIIGGLDSSYTGQVVVNGQDISNLNDAELSRFRNRTVAFVFQHFHLLGHLPVIENVVMSHWFHPENTGASQMKRARQVLEQVGIGHKADATPNHLSGGEKQRVAIARALFSRPDVLLCDEPTGALDTGNGERVMELFRDLHRDHGLTVLIVTHSREVALHCERTIQISDGRIDPTLQGGP